MHQPVSHGSTCLRAGCGTNAQVVKSVKASVVPSNARSILFKPLSIPSFRFQLPFSGQKNAVDKAFQKIRGGRSDRPSAGGARKVAVMWFRNDLRVHDNEALAAANRDASSLLPIYCFDPREYGKTVNGIDTTGPYRAQFVLDAVADLRERLRAAGSDLIVRIGKPEEVVVDLAKKVGASKVYCHSEVTYEEDVTEKRVAAGLKTEDIQLKPVWGSTLFGLDELPFKLQDLPDTHGDFRSRVAALPIKQPGSVPAQLRGKPLGAQGISSGNIPTLAQLGLQPLSNIPGAPKCKGGETEGLAQLDRLLASTSRRGSGRPNFCASFSAQVSPWLSMGCLSPRRMYAEVQARQASSDAGIVALARCELLWRDFFRFTTKKCASHLIQKRSAANGGTPGVASGSSAMVMACA